MLWEKYFGLMFDKEKLSSLQKRKRPGISSVKNNEDTKKTRHSSPAAASTSAFGLSSLDLALPYASSAAAAGVSRTISSAPPASITSAHISNIRLPTTVGTRMHSPTSATSTTTSLLPRSRGAAPALDSLSGIAARAMQASKLASNARLKNTMKHPHHHRAWQAASKGKKEVRLGDLLISNPQVAKPLDALHARTSDESSATPPASGFVMTGSFSLFGTSKTAQLKSWHGPPPTHVVIGKELPIYQHAEVDCVLASDFLPLLAGTPMDTFEFENVTFTFQNYNLYVIRTHILWRSVDDGNFSEPSKPLGWSMTANITIGEKNGAVHRILSGILQVPQQSLKLRVLTALGLGHSWAKLPSVSTFTVEGLLDLTSALADDDAYGVLPLCNGVTLSRVGLRLSGVRSMTFGIGGKMTMAYGFAVFGDMHVETPASKSPLEFDFEISEFADMVQLVASLKGNIWQNAFGLGLDVRPHQ
jgi:hypothetical protein